MKAFIPIQLDKVRNLRYGMRAMVLIEESIGKSMTSLDMDSLSMKDMSIIIWAGLQHEDKNLTPESVMDLIDDYSDIGKVSEAMSKAMEAAFTSGEIKNDETPGKKASRSASKA